MVILMAYTFENQINSNPNLILVLVKCPKFTIFYLTIVFWISIFRCSLEVKTMEEIMKFTPNIFLHFNIQEREFNEFLEAIMFLNNTEQKQVLKLYSKIGLYDICSLSLKRFRIG